LTEVQLFIAFAAGFSTAMVVVAIVTTWEG